MNNSNCTDEIIINTIQNQMHQSKRPAAPRSSVLCTVRNSKDVIQDVFVLLIPRLEKFVLLFTSSQPTTTVCLVQKTSNRHQGNDAGRRRESVIVDLSTLRLNRRAVFIFIVNKARDH